MLVTACAGSGTGYVIPEPVPNRYDSLDPAGMLELGEAVALIEAGRSNEAYDALVALTESRPANVALGAWLQEAELEQEIDRALEESAGVAPEQAVAEAADRLRASYRAHAEAQPTPTALVLAARLEPDPPAARLLLERAIELDSACAPAHYGLAYVDVREGDYGAAREALARALEADPAHLPSVRLSGWMLLQAGRREEAVAVLRAFLDASQDDPRVPEILRAETRLDVVIALLADGRTEEAQEELMVVEESLVEPGRRLGAQVVVLNHLGRHREARETALEAQRRDLRVLLPVVQEALLLEQYLGRPYEARLAWQRVLERAEADPDLGDVLQRLRAEVHRARLERELTTWKDSR